MKYSFTAAALLAVQGAFASPLDKRAACSSAVTLSAGSNPFSGRTLWANPYYAAEVKAAAAAITDSTLAAKAAKVGAVGSFMWIDTISKISQVEANIKDAPCSSIVGLVIYDLPGRDCAAKASNGELAVGQLSTYKTSYIDPIVTLLKKYPNTAFALVIEPDSLPNLVTNADLATCQASAQGYKDGVAYALQKLNLPNVAMYIDAGHGGWLGWNDNLSKFLASIVTPTC